MFQIIENTPDRLVIRMGLWPFQTTTATLDKSTGKATFERSIFFVKREPIEIPLEEIDAISVVHQQMATGQATQESDNPLVQLKSGTRFWLSDPGTQAKAAEAVQLMRQFLGRAGAALGGAGAAVGAAGAALGGAGSALGGAGSAAAGEAAADQPVVIAHPSRAYRFAVTGISVVAVAAFLIGAGYKLTHYFVLPDCDEDITRKTVAQIIEDKKIKPTPLTDVKLVSSSGSERLCAAKTEIPGASINMQYRIDWNGWSPQITVTEFEAQAKVDSAHLGDVKKASEDFLALARDSPVSGRPPRQSELRVRTLLDKVFDLTKLEGATLAASDIGKATEWYSAGDRAGTVYILSGTGVSDIDRLPNTPSIQQRMHRNVAEFAPEFGRYLDFQVKITGMIADAHLKRMAKGDGEADLPDVKRDIEAARSTFSEVLTGDLTTLAYEGLNDEWRRQRLAVMMQAAPKAAKFLRPDQARTLRQHAITVTTFVSNKGVQEQIRAFADAVAGR